MSNLGIVGNQSTPSITADWNTGLMCMQGDSYPENSFEYFGPVIDWIERFLLQTYMPLRLELRLVYMNTSSVKVMMDIFDLLEEYHGLGREVRVDWYYDPRNERVVRLADEFKEDCKFPFEIKADVS